MMLYAVIGPNAGWTDPSAAAPSDNAAALGKPRDLQAETIVLRRESAVLSRLLECLNG